MKHLRRWGFLLLLSDCSCASAGEGSRPERREDRASRVAALEAMRGDAGAVAVVATVTLLDDGDSVVRWTAARNLLALPPDSYQEALLRRLPGFPKRSLRLGLEVLRRANADVDPSRLRFLADLRDGEGRQDDNARHRSIRTLAARLLAGASRRRESVSAIFAIARDSYDVDETSRAALAADRDAVAEEIERTFKDVRIDHEFIRDRGEGWWLLVRLIAETIEDPRVMAVAARLNFENEVRTALEKVASPAAIAQALACADAAEIGEERRGWLFSSLAKNPNVGANRLERYLTGRVGPVRDAVFGGLVERYLLADPAALVRFLDRWDRKDVPSAARYAISVFCSIEYGEFKDEKLLAALLESRSEWFRQHAAACIVVQGLEPLVDRARRVLREAAVVAFPMDALPRLYRVDRDLGELLAWRALRSNDPSISPPGIAYEIAIQSGRAELVDIARRRAGENWPTDHTFLWCQALLTEDREVFLRHLASEDKTARFFGALGLVRRGDSEGLVPFIEDIERILGVHLRLPFEAEHSPYDLGERDLRRHVPRALRLMSDRFTREQIVEAVEKAWEDPPPWPFALLAEELGDPALAPRLRVMLAESEYGPLREAAARAMGSAAGADSVAALRRALDDGNMSVRRAALESLALLEDPELVLRLVSALQTGGSEAGDYAARALYNLGTGDVIRALSERAVSEDPFEILNVAEILVALAPDRETTVQAAVRCVMRDPYWHQDWLMRYFEKRPDAVARLVPLELSTHEKVRESVARYLGAASTSEGVEALVRMLDNRSLVVRTAALDSLTRLKSPEGLARAVAISREVDFSEPTQELGHALLGYLTTLESPECEAFLVRMVREGGFWLRGSAFVALARLKSRRAFEVLLADWERDPETFWVSHDAPATLRLMTGVSGLRTLEEWEEWWSVHWKDYRFPEGLVEPNWSNLFEFSDPEPPPRKPFDGAAITPFEKVRDWHGVCEARFSGRLNFVVGDATTWKSLWRRFRMPVPPVDFTRYSAIVVLWPDPDVANINQFLTRFAGFIREEGKTVVCVERWQGGLVLTQLDDAGTDWRIILVPKIGGEVEFRFEDVRGE